MDLYKWNPRAKWLAVEFVGLAIAFFCATQISDAEFKSSLFIGVSFAAAAFCLKGWIYLWDAGQQRYEAKQKEKHESNRLGS